MLSAEIIAIGSELLTPFHTDTNSLWLTEQLNAIGIDVKLKTIVGDDEARLETAINDALSRSQIVISTGGLGPTEDDITRKIFSQALKRPLILSTEILATIRGLFESRGFPMAPNNEKQALILAGAQILHNAKGTAPGMLINEDGKVVVILPGPPREMKPMFEQQILPVLQTLSAGMRVKRRVIRVAGMGESALDSLIAPIYGQYQNPTTTILFTRTDVQIHLTAHALSDELAEGLLSELATKIIEKLGTNVFSVGGASLEEVVGQLLLKKQYTIATAESCTGGLISTRLTDVPGSSQYFFGGVVSYTVQAKIDILGVPTELINTYGVVSGEVAEAMAQGIRRLSGATIGVSVTGFAGPDSGDGQPVGLVYIGLASESDVSHKRLQLPGGRERVRWFSSTMALDMIRRKYLI